MIDVAAAVDTEEIRAQEKCTRQSVQIAKRNAKFLSSHQVTGLFIAGIVSESTRNTKVVFSLASRSNFFNLLSGRGINLLRSLLIFICSSSNSVDVA